MKLVPRPTTPDPAFEAMHGHDSLPAVGWLAAGHAGRSDQSMYLSSISCVVSSDVVTDNTAHMFLLRPGGLFTWNAYDSVLPCPETRAQVSVIGR